MILLYHKVFLEPLTEWWVSVDTFNRQMCALSAYDVVSLDDYDCNNPRHVVITFDGVYENIFEYALPILKKWGYPFELFITGKYIGESNQFDSVEPETKFCNLQQLECLIKSGGVLQWHTFSHQRLNGLNSNDLDKELSVPESLRKKYPPPHFNWFAYPHGDHDDNVLDKVKRHFLGALSCDAGNDLDCFKLNRLTVRESTILDQKKVTVIIANYNYGEYFHESIESVLNQTVQADEIIIIDDCSTDNSITVINQYKDYVSMVVLNEKNLGIIDNFNKAVELANGDYVCILGADNRMRADYIEKCKTALNKNPKAVVAYTDMTIFGPLSDILAKQVSATFLGNSRTERWNIYKWTFSDPTDEALSQLHQTNFIHGSSMYKKEIWQQVGGYQKSVNAEDHNLFQRMLCGENKAVRVPHSLIEYRQHSHAQANSVLSQKMKIKSLFDINHNLSVQLDETKNELTATKNELTKIKLPLYNILRKIFSLQSRLITKCKKTFF